MTVVELRNKLLAHSGLSALIGTRLYPVAFPQNPTLPLVTLAQVSGRRPVTADGATGNANTRWQIEAWARTYQQAKELALQVRLAVNTLPGATGTSVIYMAELESEIDLFDPETRLYRVPMDVVLWNSESL